MDDNTKKALTAVGVGVGATAVIGAAMYFLGGREAPHVPSMSELGAFGKSEIGLGALTVDPSLTLTEHPGVRPAAYMAHSNLKNIIHDAEEMLSLMNERDVLPQWADESIASAKMNVSKMLGYVRSKKTRDV